MRRKTTALDQLAAAYMYAVQRRSQGYIGGVLGVSQSVVSRLLKDAENEGYLETSVRFVTRKLSPERLREVEFRASPRGMQLAERLQLIARTSSPEAVINVRILPSASTATSPAAWTHRLERYGSLAQDYVRALLMEAGAAGVAWGVTVASVVRALQGSATGPFRPGDPIEFVPLMGEPLGSATSRVSSTRLAVDLDLACNGGNENSLSLALVPAMIPQDFTPTEVKAIRRLIAHVQPYQEIFETRAGGAPPWVDSLDAILTSVSTVERPLGFQHDNLVRTAKVSRTRLEDAVIGDICGALVPRQGREKDVRTFSDFWTGITLDQIRACARRCLKAKKPGVILLAIGRNKAPVAFEAARMGLVNHLIIDQDLADRIEELCAGAT